MAGPHGQHLHAVQAIAEDHQVVADERAGSGIRTCTPQAGTGRLRHVGGQMSARVACSAKLWRSRRASTPPEALAQQPHAGHSQPGTRLTSEPRSRNSLQAVMLAASTLQEGAAKLGARIWPPGG